MKPLTSLSTTACIGPGTCCARALVRTLTGSVIFCLFQQEWLSGLKRRSAKSSCRKIYIEGSNPSSSSLIVSIVMRSEIRSPHRPVVRTPSFHDGNMGSNPIKDIMLNSLNKIDNSVLSSVKRLSPLNMKRSNNNYLFAFVANHLIYYPTPISLTYAWSFGFLAGMCLLTQMISGIFLAMHYTPHVDLAFSSVEYIMRDVPNGWFLRYVHANGASMFFIVVYSHIFRGLYY